MAAQNPDAVHAQAQQIQQIQQIQQAQQTQQTQQAATTTGKDQFIVGNPNALPMIVTGKDAGLNVDGTALLVNRAAQPKITLDANAIRQAPAERQGELWRRYTHFVGHLAGMTAGSTTAKFSQLPRTLSLQNPAASLKIKKEQDQATITLQMPAAANRPAVSLTLVMHNDAQIHKQGAKVQITPPTDLAVVRQYFAEAFAGLLRSDNQTLSPVLARTKTQSNILVDTPLGHLDRQAALACLALVGPQGVLQEQQPSVQPLVKPKFVAWDMNGTVENDGMLRAGIGTSAQIGARMGVTHAITTTISRACRKTARRGQGTISRVLWWR